MKSNLRSLPVVLCHAACTGGSLFYKVLISAFDFWGVHEVGHKWITAPGSFLPFDPEAQLCNRVEVAPETVADIFWRRVKNCENIANDHDHRLLIREHTHQYYFDSAECRGPTGFSWIVENYASREGQFVPSIVTVRDPIDSWLGLRSSFGATPYSFDEYCACYNRWLDGVDSAKSRGLSVIVLRYEDLIGNFESVIDEIGVYLNMRPRPDAKATFSNVQTSGNSGRVANKITRRPRRPYTGRLVHAAKASSAYEGLIARLGYPTIDAVPRFKGALYEVRSIAATSAGLLIEAGASPLRWIRKQFKGLQVSD